jgi:biopolymer transport protein ExbD
MRLSKHKRPTRALMNMTPMIDITFLLIIFFMTVTQVSEINKERLELPKLEGSDDQLESNVTINVDHTGQVIVSGNKMTVPELIYMVGDELKRVGNEPSRVTIVIRADERGTSKTVNEIVTSLARFQITRVRIAVQVPEP